ncbi:MAG: hypothetical protein ACPGWR_14895 [Ardenticatenaceae bacterium]
MFYYSSAEVFHQFFTCHSERSEESVASEERFITKFGMTNWWVIYAVLPKPEQAADAPVLPSARDPSEAQEGCLFYEAIRNTRSAIRNGYLVSKYAIRDI